MSPDQYAPCPCGSGKKFKWCCQPIWIDINKAFEQDMAGQHDTAFKTIEAVTIAHPTNPEAWGRKAVLLARHERFEEAENAVQKAFEINPNYPFGLYLQGTFRMNEGEIPGALLLFRKAAEHIDPEARDLLGQVYTVIADCELRLNRPVAMHAAVRIASRLDPADEQLRQVLSAHFGDESKLPLSAKRDYTFLPAPAALTGEGRAAWDQALNKAATGRLGDAARAFEELTRADENNAAAWYNLAVVRTWLGDNRNALAALDRYVGLESDASRAAGAWSLGEVLRLGLGMEEHADVLEYSYLYRVADPNQVMLALQEWQKQRRLVPLQVDQERGVYQFLVLERPVTLTADPASARLPKLGANLMLVQNALRIWNTNADAVKRVRDELLQRAATGLAEEQQDTETANFANILADALAFPADIAEEAEAHRRVREEFQKYFEETWPHKPLKSLAGVPPIDAASHPVLGRKLAGVVQFLEECASISAQPYDFNRLRRKLALLPGEAAQPGALVAPAGPDVGAMSTQELAGLPADSLNDDQLEQAFRSAIKLDARDVAGKFALALVARPPQAGKGDRYPWYSHLIGLAVAEGNTDAALDFINDGVKADCEHNAGQRRNDYELRRGQVHAKRGETDQAQEVFDRLIERAPGELKYRGTAAEAMLSARQGARALQFAEAGLAKAREQQNRDSEGYFMELTEAAKRQG